MDQFEELLRWITQAGCFLIFVGIESLDKATLHRARKAPNLKVGIGSYRGIIRAPQAHGIAMSADIILGRDGDTPETFHELERFVVDSRIDSPVYTILTPPPGTELWARFEGEGRLRLHSLPSDYAYCDAHHVLYQPLRLTPDELLAAHRSIVRRNATPKAFALGLWHTWRRAGRVLAALAAAQNRRWAGINARSS